MTTESKSKSLAILALIVSIVSAATSITSCVIAYNQSKWSGAMKPRITWSTDAIESLGTTDSKEVIKHKLTVILKNESDYAAEDLLVAIQMDGDPKVDCALAGPIEKRGESTFVVPIKSLPPKTDCWLKLESDIQKPPVAVGGTLPNYGSKDWVYGWSPFVENIFIPYGTVQHLDGMSFVNGKTVK